MKILGIDYGTKRIGIALSDEGESFAFPKMVLENNAKIIGTIREIITENEVGKIVVGDPGENKLSADVKKFVSEIETEFSLPVILEKEFMTSLHVSQFLGVKPIARLLKKSHEPKKDESAAALILQRYLDKNKK